MVLDSQDMMFYGPLESCAMCGGQLEYTGKNYRCQGRYSEWTTCPYTTINPPRKSDRIKVPEDINNETAREVCFVLYKGMCIVCV